VVDRRAAAGALLAVRNRARVVGPKLELEAMRSDARRHDRSRRRALQPGNQLAQEPGLPEALVEVHRPDEEAVDRQIRVRGDERDDRRLVEARRVDQDGREQPAAAEPVTCGGLAQPALLDLARARERQIVLATDAELVVLEEVTARPDDRARCDPTRGRDLRGDDHASASRRGRARQAHGIRPIDPVVDVEPRGLPRLPAQPVPHRKLIAPCLQLVAQTAPGVVVNASTRRVKGRRLSSLALGVFEPTTGTPFESVAHTLVVSTGKRLFSATPTLSRATVRAPGDAVSGTLRLKPTAKLKRRRFSNCRHGIASRPARVASGALTAIYDSIGTRVFDTNLNSAYVVPPMLNRTS